jgi:hypothetical protein
MLAVSTKTTQNPKIPELIYLFNALEIKHLISYDDQWSILDKPQTEEFDESKLQMDISSFFVLYGETVDEEILTLLSNEGIDNIKELLESEAPELGDLIKKCEERLYLSRDDKSLQNLNNLLKQIQSEGITVSKFEKVFDEKDVSSIQGRILFLVDMNMEELGEGQDVVIETILNIKKVRPKDHDIVIVYSHENLVGYVDHNSKLSYVDEFFSKEGKESLLISETKKYLIPYQLWAISKKTEEEELLTNLKNTLEQSVFGHSLHDFLEDKVDQIEKSMIDLVKLPEEIYNHLYRDSFVEGEIFLDILNRTHESVLNKVEWENVIDSNYKKLANSILRVASEKNKAIFEEIKTNGIKKYRKETKANKLESGIYKGLSEHGLVDYKINHLYKDIMTGDIFKIYIEKDNQCESVFGILIDPDCDLLIRFGNSHEQISRNINKATLLICRGESIKDSLKAIKDGEGIWPIVDGGNYISLFPDSKSELMGIDCRILDLCSLNDEGWASLTPNYEEIKDYKTYFFNHFFDSNIKKWINEVQDITTYFSSDLKLAEAATAYSKEVEDQPIDILSELKNILVKYKYSIMLDQSNNKFVIKRIGRLDIRRTLQLVQLKLFHNSRIGLETNPWA